VGVLISTVGVTSLIPTVGPFSTVGVKREKRHKVTQFGDLWFGRIQDSIDSIAIPVNIQE